MAQATNAYTISDPVQDGDQDLLLHALLSGDQKAQGDYHSSSGAVGLEDDLDSLFDEPLDHQEEADILIPDDAEFLLPDFGLFLDTPLDYELDALLNGSAVDYAPTDDGPSNVAQSAAQNSASAQDVLDPAPLLESSSLRPASPQSISKSAQAASPPINSQTVTGLSIPKSPTTSTFPDRTSPQQPVVHPHPKLDDASSSHNSASANDVSKRKDDVQQPSGRVFPNSMSTTQNLRKSPIYSNRVTVDESPIFLSTVDDHLIYLDAEKGARSPSINSSRGRSRAPLTPPASTSPEDTTHDARVPDESRKTSLSETVLIRRGNCSPIRSLFTREEPAEEPSKKKRKTSKTTKTQAVVVPTSKENLRLSLMLDIRAYHYLVEKVKQFMLDAGHPQRYEDAVFVGLVLSPDEQSAHERKLEDLASTLLQEEDLAETWWGEKSFGYATRDLKWPRNKSTIIKSLVKLLVRVCREHEDKQQIKPYAVSDADVEKMVELASRKALRDRVSQAKDNVECHISFVLADNLRHSIREKVIASTSTYPRYMDLVNFLVKLITDRHTMTGLGVLGPLGYAKVNTQWEWEAMLEVIRTTPTMCSIALCTVETQPHETALYARPGRRASAKATPIVREVIEID